MPINNLSQIFRHLNSYAISKHYPFFIPIFPNKSIILFAQGGDSLNFTAFTLASLPNSKLQ